MQGETRVVTKGIARGNPGMAGAGIIITRPDVEVRKGTEPIGKFLGRATQLQAELLAMIEALDIVRGRELGAVSIHIDCEPIWRLVMGSSRPQPDLLKYYERVTALLYNGPAIPLRLVHSSETERAEHLANQAIDTRGRSAALE
jgi:ribonuclease HI